MCGFAPESLSLLQDKLSRTYTNPQFAVLRELIQNGWDGQVANGVTTPITVTLPTVWDPTLIVADAGVGMSEDTVLELYSQYGFSSKRDSDLFAGALGIGSKSPFAIGEQFVVSTTHKGVTTVAVLGKSEENVVELEISQVKNAGKPDGTSVSVPVPEASIALFKSAADRLGSLIPSNTFCVEGVPNTQIGGIRVSENILLVEDGTLPDGKDWIVMLGVPYPVDAFYDMENTKRVGLCDRPGHFLVNVPPDSVNFPLSRDQLEYSEKTRRYLTGLRKTLRKSYVKFAQRQVSAARTRAEGAAQYDLHSPTVEKLFGKQLPAQWGGVDIPPSFTTQGHVWNNVLLEHPGRRKLDGRAKINVVRSTVPEALFVTGSPYPTTPTVGLRNKTRSWMEQNDVRRNVVVFCDEFTDDGWCGDGFVSVHADEVKALKVPKVKRKTGGTSAAKKDPEYGVYDGYRTWAATVRMSELCSFVEDGGLVVYGDFSEGSRDANWTKELSEDRAGRVKCVHVTSNRVDKFVRLLPDAVSRREAFRMSTEAFLRNNPPPVVYPANADSLYSFTGDAYKILSTVVDSLEDPAVKQSLDFQQKVLSPANLRYHQRLTEYERRSGGRFAAAPHMVTSDDFPSVSDKYPLLHLTGYYQFTSAGETARQHFVDVLNGLWRERQSAAASSDMVE